MDLLHQPARRRRGACCAHGCNAFDVQARDRSEGRLLGRHCPHRRAHTGHAGYIPGRAGVPVGVGAGHRAHGIRDRHAPALPVYRDPRPRTPPPPIFVSQPHIRRGLVLHLLQRHGHVRDHHVHSAVRAGCSRGQRDQLGAGAHADDAWRGGKQHAGRATPLAVEPLQVPGPGRHGHHVRGRGPSGHHEHRHHQRRNGPEHGYSG